MEATRKRKWRWPAWCTALVEHPPLLYRILFPGALWSLPKEKEKVVYLTFDDGPIPEVTPWVLSVLREKGVKATFFCVGDNVRKHPEVFEQVKAEGHAIGNHTFNHLQGWKVSLGSFMANVQKADEWLEHTDLFRPPHGHLRWSQFFRLRKKYKMVMWDVVTRDYSKHQTPEGTLDSVCKYVKNGSIIVFHDSIKSEANLRYALPKAIDYLLSEGYRFSLFQ
ncbi:MAG: polysaccharide deacetylase family protein [Porphyromonas sp.]|nr:polysaccharide deacetylase family protein [Porphyromonas sp.]